MPIGITINADYTLRQFNQTWATKLEVVLGRSADEVQPGQAITELLPESVVNLRPYIRHDLSPIWRK